MTTGRMTSDGPAEGRRGRSASGYDLTPLTPRQREGLAERLTQEERSVLLDGGTERPFCGGLLKNEEEGVYGCRLCRLPLFSSESKYDSRTGWPSFFQPFDPEHVRTLEDTSHGMRRTEIRCTRCSGHLGHVFPDGPEATGLRYCINSIALEFFRAGDLPGPGSDEDGSAGANQSSG